MAHAVGSALAEVSHHLGTNDARLWLVASAGSGHDVAGSIALRAGEVTLDLGPQRDRPQWPSVDPRMPNGQTLHHVAPERAYMWLQTREEVLGLLDLRWTEPPRHRATKVEGAALRPLLCGLRALWRELDARVSPSADAIMTPDGTIQSACGRATQVLNAATVDALRAASGGPLPSRILAGPLCAVLKPLDGTAERRTLIRLEPAQRLSVGYELLLSKRRLEVALLAAKGTPALEIAAVLGITEATVKSHLQRTYQILDVANRIDLHELLKHLL